jgi:hypothetical protein
MIFYPGIIPQPLALEDISMDEQHFPQCTAFEGSRIIASGDLMQVAMKAKDVIDRKGTAPVLIFDDLTSEVIEVDFRGTGEDVYRRLVETATSGPASPPPEAGRSSPKGPGRPRLGVVSREVTLLPRHWDWLNSQPGGASVALRKLVEEARRVNGDRDRVRQSQEAAYTFMSAMAGDLPGFEEATRALFAGDRTRFDNLVASWPSDIRDHARRISDAALRIRGHGSEG